MAIQYLVGDATRPVGDGAKIIVHVCNDIGKWGRGFVLAVSRRWPEPERVFKALFKAGEESQLGDVQFVQVDPGITVANVIGQHGIASRSRGRRRFVMTRSGLASKRSRSAQRKCSRRCTCRE